jgi:Fe-S-cluster containining protein
MMQEFDKSPIPIPESALVWHKNIMIQLHELNALPPAKDGSPSEKFEAHFDTLMETFEKFQQTILTHYGKTVTCSRGCSFCCSHWVEDVYSFESTRIIRYLKNHYRTDLPRIISLCQSDVDAMEGLHVCVDQKLAALPPEERESLDQVDLLLSCFYRLERPCAFLTNEGSCGIYAVRPLTCRIYISFSQPDLCRPANIDGDETMTYLLDFEEEASLVLDELHQKYDVYDGDLGLRSVMADALKKDCKL